MGNVAAVAVTPQIDLVISQGSACGVDVFGTLEAIGLSLEIVTSETQSCTLCGLILFDSRA